MSKVAVHHSEHGRHGHGQHKQDVEQRKAQLVRQGEFYRVGIMHAKAQVKHGARPETMFHSAIDHATFALRSRVDGLLRPTGVSIGSIMPYAVSLFGLIRRRRLGKPALGVTLLIAGIGWYIQHRRTPQYVE